MQRLLPSVANLRLALIWPLFVLMTGPALADARLTVLVDVLKLPEAAQILREEGLSHATELDVDMLGGRGGPGWEIQIGAIYDTARMVETVRRALESELQEPDLSAELEQTIDFFASYRWKIPHAPPFWTMTSRKRPARGIWHWKGPMTRVLS